jgi:hypothetical protein
MSVLQTQSSLPQPPISHLIPFALMQHEDATVEAEKHFGCPSQDWSWTPSGEFDVEELAIYASMGSTSRMTIQGQWDHGEFY